MSGNPPGVAGNKDPEYAIGSRRALTAHEEHMASLRNPHLRPNADNHAHLAYYDQDTQLSFSFNGSYPAPGQAKVGIAHGGYAEPILASVSDRELNSPTLLLTFELVCQTVVEMYREVQELLPNGTPQVWLDEVVEEYERNIG